MKLSHSLHLSVVGIEKRALDHGQPNYVCMYVCMDGWMDVSIYLSIYLSIERKMFYDILETAIIRLSMKDNEEIKKNRKMQSKEC